MKRKSSKHIAVVTKVKEEVEIPAHIMHKGIGELLGIVGWEEMEEKERAYITAYGYWGDEKKAEEEVGVDNLWVETRKWGKEGFREALIAIREKPRDVATVALEGMMPWSVMELRRLMAQDENKVVKLQAIRHYHIMMGMMPKEGSITEGQFLNVSVRIFGEEKRIIEGDGQRNEGA